MKGTCLSLPLKPRAVGDNPSPDFPQASTPGLNDFTGWWKGGAPWGWGVHYLWPSALQAPSLVQPELQPPSLVAFWPPGLLVLCIECDWNVLTDQHFPSLLGLHREDARPVHPSDSEWLSLLGGSAPSWLPLLLGSHESCISCNRARWPDPQHQWIEAIFGNWVSSEEIDLGSYKGKHGPKNTPPWA